MFELNSNLFSHFSVAIISFGNKTKGKKNDSYTHSRTFFFSSFICYCRCCRCCCFIRKKNNFWWEKKTYKIHSQYTQRVVDLELGVRHATKRYQLKKTRDKWNWIVSFFDWIHLVFFIVRRLRFVGCECVCARRKPYVSIIPAAVCSFQYNFFSSLLLLLYSIVCIVCMAVKPHCSFHVLLCTFMYKYPS